MFWHEGCSNRYCRLLCLGVWAAAKPTLLQFIGIETHCVSHLYADRLHVKRLNPYGWVTGMTLACVFCAGPLSHPQPLCVLVAAGALAGEEPAR